MTYAADTSVPADRSRAEIEKTLARYGASQFMYGWDDDRAIILFRMSAEQGYRQVRFVLEMPPKTAFSMTPGGRRRRSPAQIEQAFDQAVRSKWRALLLVVKAKLEAVESGIASFDQEFLAHIMLPNGETVGEWIATDLDEAYAAGKMIEPLRLALPAAGGTS